MDYDDYFDNSLPAEVAGDDFGIEYEPWYENVVTPYDYGFTEMPSEPSANSLPSGAVQQISSWLGRGAEALTQRGINGIFDDRAPSFRAGATTATVPGNNIPSNTVARAGGGFFGNPFTAMPPWLVGLLLALGALVFARIAFHK